MIRAVRGISPTIAASAYIDASAQVIGDVTVGENSSVWCHCTLRGDVHFIRVGDETNIQDNTVIHCEYEKHPTILGNRVSIGHSVVLHGCEVEDDCLVGIGAIILNGAKIGRGSVIAAGALVPEYTEIPPESLVMGVPAKVRRQVSDEERARFRATPKNYIEYSQWYKDQQT
jgi:gamma-carbonic anhydrase